MKRVPTTHFIGSIGKYSRDDETVVVTAHGADGAIPLPPSEYRRPTAAVARPETPGRDIAFYNARRPYSSPDRQTPDGAYLNRRRLHLRTP